MGEGAAEATHAMEASRIRIGTRGSELALRQARMVQESLAARGTGAELVTFQTVGDKKLDQPLSAIGAKGLFTRELEEALVNGRVDCCVHSLKDLPTALPDGLALVALLPREDPRDVLVVNRAVSAFSLEELPPGSRVGTSSLRRRAQLLHARPDVEVVELRGNVPTRVRKVDDGQVHAAILAAAGLLRLGIHQRIDAWLDAPGWLPAAGQGVIAVQARADDARLHALLQPLHHAPSALRVAAERAFLAALEGGCQVPIGALAMDVPTGLVLYGLIADLSGADVVRGSEPVAPDDPEGAGVRLAEALLGRGGAEILAGLRDLERVPAPQPE